jgi:hypothetical protein
MSRHSKNNTAQSVFTYSERQKLKNKNEWGEVTARIGSNLKCLIFRGLSKEI